MKILKVAYSVILIIMLCSCSQKENTEHNKEYNYVGSINSDVYHYSYCRWANKIKAENEIWFSDVEEAQKEGYRSCNTCNP